jgi:two-component system cell cycle response regulator
LNPEESLPIPRSKVLIVDDNVQNRELLVAYVEDIPNVTTSIAANGIDALAQVANDPPDLVLLDVMMPRMSGFEVCRRLKSDPQTRDIQVMMVTALDEVGDHERARDCGTDEFVAKPVNRQDLVTRISGLLRLRHLKRGMEGQEQGTPA